MFHDGVVRLVVFRLGAERFGIALSLMDEVVDMPTLQRMPDAPPGVLGVASVRGSLVTVYDPGIALNVTAGAGGAALLFSYEGRRVALAVDDVLNAIVVEEREVLSAPGVGSDGILKGVIRRGEELVAVLDGLALLEAAMVATEGEPR